MLKIIIAIMFMFNLNNSIQEETQQSEPERAERIEQIQESLWEEPEEESTVTKPQDKTEDDIYSMNKPEDTFIFLPLKAKTIEYGGVAFTFLNDGQGSFYILTNMILEEDTNYIGLINTKNDTLVNIKEDNFKFTNEEFFTEYEEEDTEIAIELYQELQTKM